MVIDRDQLEFAPDCVVKFTGGSEDPDWKDLKVSLGELWELPAFECHALTNSQAKIIELGIEKPFMAFPPGATVGKLAKQDDSEITEEDLKKLNDAKLQFGGADAVFSKMTGKSFSSVPGRQGDTSTDILEMTSNGLSGTHEQTIKESSPLLNSPARQSLKNDPLTAVVVEVVVDVDGADVVVVVVVDEEVDVVEVDEEVEVGEVDVMVDTEVTETVKRPKVPVCHLLSVLHKR